MKQIKMLTLVLAIAVAAASLSSCGLLALVGVGGSYAYYSDEDYPDNVFTVGNVEIELYESKLHREGYYDSDSSNDGIAYSDSDIIEDAEDYEDWWSEQELVPGRMINRMPYVKNTGGNAAYVRIRVMIPYLPDDDLVDYQHCSEALESEFYFEGDWEDPEITNIDGVEYAVFKFVRNEALEPDEMTYWNVWNTFGMSGNATIQDLDDATAAGAIENGALNILVEADGIQANGFDSAEKAFAAFDGE